MGLEHVDFPYIGNVIIPIDEVIWIIISNIGQLTFHILVFHLLLDGFGGVETTTKPYLVRGLQPSETKVATVCSDGVSTTPGMGSALRGTPWDLIYPLVICDVAMENNHLYWFFPFKN